jgi:hypothetical protein
MATPGKKTTAKAKPFDAALLSEHLKQVKARVTAEASDAQKAIEKTNLAADIKGLMSHPLIFGAGIGIGNGLLAKARSMRFTTRATLVTAGVLTIGEAILAADQTTEQRHGRTPLVFGLISGVGVLLGLALFTDWATWAGGDRPILVASLGKPATNRNAIVPSAPQTAVV